MALGAGLVKGVSGSGFGAIMMLGQLLAGADLGSAVAATVASKILPGALALAPRLLHGLVDPATAAAITLGSLASIPIAPQLQRRAGGRRRHLYAGFSLYAASMAIYLLITTA